MVGWLILGLLLANAAVSPDAAAQAAGKPVAAAPAQDPADKAWPPEHVMRTGEGVTSPEVISEVKPGYTAAAMRARVQGLVEVEAVVLADGTVGPVRVVRSLDKEFGLDQKAVDAVKKWRFRPGKRDGKAVSVLVNIELTFTLRDKRK